MRWLAWAGGLGLGLGILVGTSCTEPAANCPVGASGCPCTAGGSCDSGLACIAGNCMLIDCPVGSMGCPCTDGGACDQGLVCDGSTCTDGSATSGSPTSMGPGPGSGAEDDGILLDVANLDSTGMGCEQTGCSQVDMLFAIDSSLSMTEEINALSASQAFNAIVQDLSELNCGDIEYRIGLTNDNDGGFIGFGAEGNPWFDSLQMTPEEISSAFTTAAGSILGAGGTAIGCEHVLSSSLATLALDTTGFLRPEALLVLVLITDVDDYGYYDQDGSGFCEGLPVTLCQTMPQPVDTIYNQLVTLKGGDPAGLATIVVAGDPDVTEGMNFCGQPASCCGNGAECGQAHHAPRLWEFAAMQEGTNGFTGDICNGANQVPLLIQEALGDNIDLACQTYEPEG